MIVCYEFANGCCGCCKVGNMQRWKKLASLLSLFLSKALLLSPIIPFPTVVRLFWYVSFMSSYNGENFNLTPYKHFLYKLFQIVSFKEYCFVDTFPFLIMSGSMIYNCKPCTILFLLFPHLTQAFYLIIKVLQLKRKLNVPHCTFRQVS